MKMVCLEQVLMEERGVTMSGGEVAAIIAAIAFVVLVAFCVPILIKASKTMNQLAKTIDETNRTINVVTKDVEVLTDQVEGLLVKSNELLADVTKKVETIDPLFEAIADLSVTVSDLNYSSRNMATKVGGIGRNAAKATVASKLAGSALHFMRNKKK